jgi:hypothetical protein
MPEIQVESTGELICHRCGGPLVLTVRIPHSFTRADGHVVSGQRAVGLCLRCDRDDLAAQGVLAFFTVHEAITEDTVRQVGPVLMEWITHLTAHPPTGCTDTDLDEEIRRWQAGEL